MTIDRKYLWNGSISVNFRSGKIIDGWASGRTAQIPYTGDFLRLAPGEKYRETYKFILTEDREFGNFFKRVGQYKFTVIYQAADLDDESAEIRKWLYKNPVESGLQIQIVQCRRK